MFVKSSETFIRNLYELCIKFSLQSLELPR